MPEYHSTQENLLVLKKDNTIILGQDASIIGELTNRLQTINQLEQRNKLFQALAGSIAHELRNPLNVLYP